MNNNIKDIYGLTPTQEGIYAQYFQDSETKAYQLRSLTKISKEADLDLIKKSVELLALRHPVLKSAFAVLKSTGAIKQVILENRTPGFSVIEQDCPFSQCLLDKIVYENIPKFLDLQRETLFNVTIIDFTDERFMIIHTHHIIIDGWCFPILINDLQKYYSVLSNGMSIDELYEEINQTAVSQTSYAQYVKWIQNQDKNNALEYWRSLFEGCSISHIFGKEKKETVEKETVETFKTSLSNDLSYRIEQFAKENKVSFNTVFECAFSIALQKYSGSEDVVYDKIISGRSIPLKNIENTIGLFINTVPVHIKSDEKSTLSDLLREIQNQTIEANKYGILPLADIYKASNIDSRLIDALFVFENYYTGDISEIEKGPLSAKLISFEEQTEFNLTVTIMKESTGYTIRTAYVKEMYKESEISQFIKGYVSILSSSLDLTKIIKDISVTDMNLIENFNNTFSEYAKDKCVHELFEEQAEKTPEKTAVVASDKTLTYRELNEEANRIAHALAKKGIGKGGIVGIKLPRKSNILSALFGVLKTGAAYLPIDSEYPDERIEYMLTDSGAAFCITEENISELVDNESTENPENTVGGEDICYCIYTSGSTGKPKGTLITHRNVVNYVSANEKNVCWGITGKRCKNIVSVTTIGFDIFVTESILPLINGMEVVLADEEQSRLQDRLSELLEEYPAEVVQTTPTKMRVFIKDKSKLNYLKNLKVIILGGESLDSALVDELKLHTTAEIYNIYGPTETTVWVSYSKVENSDDITIGKPISNTKVYIVDKYLKPVPIGVRGELCIAGDGVGAGYLNNTELTAEKFVDNPFGVGKLYRTGDLAYWREDGNIVYVGRGDFQVKIRGQRIELGEIESTLQSVTGMERAVVVVRKDKQDRQYICAFYTGEEKSQKELREVLGKGLPKYMVPHIFRHLEAMPLTSSGKADRNALPEIELENIGTETEYTAPETEKEKLLAECISEVLGAEKVSVTENFFDIGGDSLKAIELTAKLETKGYTSAIKTIFSCKDIRELAEKLEEKEQENKKIEYGREIPATSAQMRVYTSQMLKPESCHYNITYGFRTERPDKEKLEKAVNKLIERHESLRTRFENREGQIVQIIESEARVVVEEVAEDDINSFSKPFELNKAPLVRAGISGETVLITLHHIITDGESMPVIFRELNELYMGREITEVPVQYGEFAVTDGYTEENEKYWLNVFDEETPVLELPTDYPREAEQSFAGSNIYEQIDIKLHRRIEEKCKERGITPYVYYMVCLSILLSKLSGNEDIVIGTPISGRQSRYLNTVGMFVNTIALRSRPKGEKTVAELLEEIRDSSIEAIENQNYPFGELVKKLKVNAIGRNPMFDVMLAYQSFAMADTIFADKKAELIPMVSETSKCDITFNVIPRTDDVVLVAEYCTDLYTENRIEQFIQMYMQLLELCMEDDKCIKNISVTDMEQIVSFNETDHRYDVSANSTVFSLFEKTAKENKEKVCIRTSDKEVSFGELLDASEQLDCAIREITGDKKSVIAIIVERSVEMYAAIYGIIRGGNAYLPIDPEYPEERISYILRNSGACAAAVQNKFMHLAGKVPCINVTGLLGNTVEKLSEVPECNVEADDTAYVIYTSGSTGNPKGAKISHKSAINRILWMHDKYPLGADDVILQKTPYTFDVSVWEHFWWGMCGGCLAVSKPGEHFLPAKILEEVYKNKVSHLHFVPSVFELFLNYLETHKEEQEKFNSVRYVFLSGEALSASLVQRFYKIYDYNKITLHNLYGPTECAVDVTYYDCCPSDIDPVPIGKPIYNTHMYVVDKYLNPVPVGVTGELCIAGTNVGQGYLNNPELTAEKFVDNPFGAGKLYRTGDLAYWREDGNIVFCGRKDGQFKLNGQRVETGEIEAVIGRFDGVDSVAVVVSESNRKYALTAFFCGKVDIEKGIKKFCRENLPKYMVPSFVIRLEEMPLNQSGKLDKNALSKIEVNISDEEFQSPIKDNERYICDRFAEILGEKNVGRNSDFFELGGTSLDMISLLCEESFGAITPAEFIKNSTPALLASLLEKTTFENTKYLEALYIPERCEEAFILLPFAGGGAEAYSNLVNSIKKKRDNTAIYFIRYLHSVQDCRCAAEEICEYLGTVDISFYSHCVGSAVALPIISHLEKCNKRVQHYYASASIPPKKTIYRNIWDFVPNILLKRILVKAGAKLNYLDNNEVSARLKDFRKDTGFANFIFGTFTGEIKTPVSIILSKTDMFTKNYRHAGLLWQKYVLNVVDVKFIDSDSHYYQSENSDELIEMIFSD